MPSIFKAICFLCGLPWSVARLCVSLAVPVHATQSPTRDGDSVANTQQDTTPPLKDPSPPPPTIPPVHPFDLAFQSLKKDIQDAAARAHSLRGRLDSMKAQEVSSREVLTRLKCHSIHRLRRARVRHIKWIVRLDEVADQTAIDASKLPCTMCVRKRRQPPSPSPSPSPAAVV